MNTRTFCAAGSCERMKAGVHLLAAALLASFAVYSVVAWRHRHESHLRTNAWGYFGGTCVEIYAAVQHLTERGHHERRGHDC